VADLLDPRRCRHLSHTPAGICNGCGEQHQPLYKEAQSWLAMARVRAVAKGATINGTYKMLPGAAIEAFKTDLLLILGDE
jgi:hypothetical protein